MTKKPKAAKVVKAYFRVCKDDPDNLFWDMGDGAAMIYRQRKYAVKHLDKEHERIRRVQITLA